MNQAIQPKLVIFDLGQTLEDNGTLLSGAIELLDAIKQMRDAHGASPVLMLASDFFPAATPQELMARQQEYYAILTGLGIRSRFEPVSQRVTLSTEVGLFKPDEVFFRTALDKILPGIEFGNAIFTTERLDHVTACRALGMEAIHFKGPGQISGEIDQLTDAIPIIRSFVESN